MGDPRHDFGIAAEQIVASWLEAGEWRILARRHRSAGGGEVDLIALDADATLVAVEVRARRTDRAGVGSETIDRHRTTRIGRTLAAFAMSTGVHHRGLRIDLVIVAPQQGVPAGWRLRRIPNIGAW